MAIKRYTAVADTTISDAFKEDLTTRATGSNMGAADVLEAFMIYGQANGTSVEKSRFLVKFDTDAIASDRTAGTIAASGSVTWMLKLYNAPHSSNLPSNFYLTAHPVTSDWAEGRGLDMVEYVYDRKEGANWVQALSASSGVGKAATATVTVANEGWVEAGDTITLTATDGTEVVCTMHASVTTSTAQTTAVQAARNGANTAAVASEIATAINYSSYFSATAASNVVTITQATPGLAGNTTVTIVEGGATGFSKTNFTGGDGVATWTSEGGDFTVHGKWGDLTSSYISGDEDMEIDISDLMEEGWLKAGGSGITNYGLIVRMPEHTETAISSSYTKKFFSRETHFFYRKPVIEARWDSAVKDDRSNFYLSSSLADSENINNLYLYNYIRGQLKAIPAVYGSTSDMATYSPLTVALYSGSTGPAGSALQIKDGDSADPSSVYAVTASVASTGVYKVQLQCTSSIESTESLFDVWFLGADPGGADSVDRREQVHTGSAIDPMKFDKGWAWTADPTLNYVVSPLNLKSSYTTREKARFRFFVRKKDWQPAVYTRASAVLKSDVWESGSYMVYRVVDRIEAVPFGTGSTAHTLMSYDSSGSFFDLDMSMLEPGYSYGVQLAFYNGSIADWVELPSNFKFRVEE